MADTVVLRLGDHMTDEEREARIAWGIRCLYADPALKKEFRDMTDESTLTQTTRGAEYRFRAPKRSYNQNPALN